MNDIFSKLLNAEKSGQAYKRWSVKKIQGQFVEAAYTGVLISP
jgi:hypothetical protein